MQLYNDVAPNWWQPNSPLAGLKLMNPHRFRYFDRFIQGWEGLEVLDVGSGGGFVSEFLAERGVRVSGIDPAQMAVVAAREHAEQSGFHINYQHGAAEKLPYGSAVFDAVVCVDVLEHVSSLEQSIAEIARVTKPGGYFFFDTINRSIFSYLFMITLMENVLGEIPKGAHDWKLFIKPDELISLLERYGFTDIEISGFNIWGRDRKNDALIVQIGGTQQVMYIGKARRQK